MLEVQGKKTEANEKGITLIAIIITVIVLMILVGVSISMLTGENGILSKAQTAKATVAEGDLKEKIGLIQMEILMDGKSISLSEIVTIGSDNKYFDSYTVVKTDSEITITDPSSGAGIVVTYIDGTLDVKTIEN